MDLPIQIYQTKKESIRIQPLTKKNIILDLDLTLVATQYEDKESLKIQQKIFEDPNLLSIRNRIYLFNLDDYTREGHVAGAGTQLSYWGIMRPYTPEFLHFCYSYFNNVIIWSAGQRHYVEAITDYLHIDLPTPHLILTHDDVEEDKSEKVVKPIAKIFKMIPDLDFTNTFVLDDSRHTYSLNKDNAIDILPYDGCEGSTIMDGDNPVPTINSLAEPDMALFELMEWLKRPEVINASDVRTLNKKKIFRTKK